MKEEPSGKFNVFDLKDARLKILIENAKKRQKGYFDNNNTGSFQYLDDEFDVIQLRVCYILFGLKLSNNNSNGLSSPEKNKEECSSSIPRGTASSLLKDFSWKERRIARKFQVKIVKYGKTKEGSVKMNVVFVSAVFKKDDGDFEPSEIRVFTLGEGTDKKYLDTVGRIYNNWEEYLTENELPKGLMIYPKDGNYTPETGEVVILNIRETPSCRLFEQTKEYLDQAAMIGGMVMAGAAFVPVAPVAAVSAATMTTVSAGSSLGTVIKAYSFISTTYELYDKIAHEESIGTEIIMLSTMAFSKFSQRNTNTWTSQLANNVAKKELWSEVSKGITRTQKVIFLMQKLINIGLSASSVLFAMLDIWMKKERSWSDWRNLAVSCFFFANVIVKPITLQALFESEQGKYIQQQFGSKATTSESKQEYEKAVENAKTTEQKTYLTRNLEKIEDLDEHFYQVHETGAIIDYTENGLVINNVTTVTPEAYNQTLNNYYQRRLNEIKLLPTEKQRSSAIKDLTKNVDKNTQKLAQKYVNDNLTEEQKTEMLTKIAKQKKDKLFANSSTTKLINLTNGQMNNETILKNLANLLNNPTKIIENHEEIWKFCKHVWNNPKIIKKFPQLILKLIDKILKNREIISNFVCTVFKSSNPERVSKIIEEIMNNSKIVLEFFQQIINNSDVIRNAVQNNLNLEAIMLILGLMVKYRQTTSKIVNHIQKNPKKVFDVVKEIQSSSLLENPDNFSQNVEILSKRLETSFCKNENECSNNDETVKPSEEKNNSQQKNSDNKNEEKYENPNFENTTVQNELPDRKISFETVKFEIEQAFAVANYCEAQVGGKQIFEDLTTGDANRLYQIINNLPADPTLKTKYFEIACKIVDDPECRLKLDSLGKFINILEIVKKSVDSRQTIKDLPEDQKNNKELFLEAVLSNNGPAYSTIRDAVSKTVKK